MPQYSQWRAVAEICQALGLDPNQVHSLKLELSTDNVVTVTAGFYPHVTEAQFAEIAAHLANPATHVRVVLARAENAPREDTDADPN